MFFKLALEAASINYINDHTMRTAVSTCKYPWHLTVIYDLQTAAQTKTKTATSGLETRLQTYTTGALSSDTLMPAYCDGVCMYCYKYIHARQKAPVESAVTVVIFLVFNLQHNILFHLTHTHIFEKH